MWKLSEYGIKYQAVAKFPHIRPPSSRIIVVWIRKVKADTTIYCNWQALHLVHALDALFSLRA